MSKNVEAKSSFKNMIMKIAQSKEFDLLGVAMIIIVAFANGYIAESLNTVMHLGGWSYFIPFGVISTFFSVLSVMSDRLTARLNNLGNVLGLVTVVTSGLVDYCLGNKGALWTYPITFIVQAYAIKKWTQSKKFKANKAPHGLKALVEYVLTIVGSIVISYFVNSLGFGSKSYGTFFYLTVGVFAMSLIANIFNALKLSAQWPFWIVYNLDQLVKAFIQGNWANVGKYIYYIINCIFGVLLWTKSKVIKNSKGKVVLVRKANKAEN